jgi:hypothetical protein
MSDALFPRAALHTARREAPDRKIYTAFGVGMAINLASIYIGNPYLISLLMVPIASVATVKWFNQPLPWIVLVSVVAANPVNLSAPISLNLICAIILLLFAFKKLNKLPSWLFPTWILASISIVGSIMNWGTTGEITTQVAAVSNYVLGPFLLLPLIYSRLDRNFDSKVLLRVFVLSEILPSVIFLSIARLFGSPFIASDSSAAFEAIVNVSIYRLGNLDFQLTRTQVGIPLAALICASFAIVVSANGKFVRLTCLICLMATLFLLLVTGSVGSSLGAICGIALLLTVATRYMSVKKFFFVPIVLGLAFVGWSQIPSGIRDYANSRYVEKVSSGIDTSDRSDRWQASVDYLLANPLGRGWDLYVAPIRTYPHNDYLSYGIAFGFVCSLLYLFVPVRLLLLIMSAKVRVSDSAQVATLLASLGAVTVLLVNSFSDHLTANRWYFNVVWSIIWYGYFATKSIDRSQARYSF